MTLRLVPDPPEGFPVGMRVLVFPNMPAVVVAVRGDRREVRYDDGGVAVINVKALLQLVKD